MYILIKCFMFDTMRCLCIHCMQKYAVVLVCNILYQLRWYKMLQTWPMDTMLRLNGWLRSMRATNVDRMVWTRALCWYKERCKCVWQQIDTKNVANLWIYLAWSKCRMEATVNVIYLLFFKTETSLWTPNAPIRTPAFKLRCIQVTEEREKESWGHTLWSA